MANLPEKNEFTAGVPLLEEGTPVKGGLDGPANSQAQVLANRTLYLKAQVEKAQQDLADHEQANDPHTQYLTKQEAIQLYLAQTTANQPNGYLQLDANGKIAAEQLALMSTKYLVVANLAERLAVTPNPELLIVAQADIDTLFYLNGGLDPKVESNWVKGQAATVSGVSRVFGRTGDITAEVGDYNADQINQTATREFVTPAQKTAWTGKQDALVSGVNIVTFKGKPLLGAGDINPTPDDLGCAAKTHKHTVADVTDFDSKSRDLLSKTLQSGSGISVIYDPETLKATIALSGDQNNGNGLTVVTRLGSTAGQSHSFLFDKPSNYNLLASVLKEEAGATNQVYTVDTFDAVSGTSYDTSSAVVFNGKLDLYAGETYTMALSGGFYRAQILADGVSVAIDATAGDVIIPTMSAATLPNGYVITESSAYSAGYAGWKAFNGNPTDPANRWSTSSGPTQWLQMQLPAARDVAAYTMQVRPDIQFGGIPATWTLSGSNDGSTWNVVDSRSNITWTAGEKKTFALSATVNYRYFRITITAVTGDTTLVTISGFNLLSPSSKAIIKGSDGKHYGVNNGTLTALNDDITQINFDASGFTQSGTIVAESLAGKLPITVISKNATKVSTKYVGKNQIAKMKLPVNGYQFARINSATLTATQTGNGKVRVAITRDNKNWLIHNGTAWVSIGTLDTSDASVTTLLNQGMTPAAFNAITTAQWTSLYDDVAQEPDAIGFAYALSAPTATDTANVDNVALNVNNASLWKNQTPAEVEIRWTRKSVFFKTISAGNYKFIYQTPV